MTTISPIAKLQDLEYRQITICLQNSGIIVYPTDTAYALGGDATNKEVVEKIFSIKGRDAGKTLSLIVADRQMAKDRADFPSRARDLADDYWPGPLTMVLPSVHGYLPAGVVQDGFIALRVPNNAIARGISARLGKPIIATSANASGQGPCYTIEEVKQSLGDSLELVDYIIDGGELQSRGVSTMVKVVDDTITVLRQGIINLF